MGVVVHDGIYGAVNARYNNIGPVRAFIRDIFAGIYFRPLSSIPNCWLLTVVIHKTSSKHPIPRI